MLLPMKVEKLSNTLRKVLAGRGLAGRLAVFRVAARWEEAVGGVVAEHARPHALKGGKLTVLVDSPVWMQQLSLLRPDLVEKVNRSLGEELVKDMLLTLGAVAGRRPRPAPAQDLPPLTPEERESARGMLAGIADPEIRAALGSLIEKDLRNKKRTREA